MVVAGNWKIDPEKVLGIMVDAAEPWRFVETLEKGIGSSIARDSGRRLFQELEVEGSVGESTWRCPSVFHFKTYHFYPVLRLLSPFEYHGNVLFNLGRNSKEKSP